MLNFYTYKIFFFTFVKFFFFDINFLIFYLASFIFLFLYNNIFCLNFIKNYKIYIFKKFSNFKYFYLFNLFLIFYFILFYLNYFYYNIFNFTLNIILNQIYFINVNLSNSLNLDYLNLYFVILNGLVFFTLFIVILNFKYKKYAIFNNLKLMIVLMFIIEFFVILTFLTSNFFFFFFFFECSLMPMYFLIQIFGKGSKKKQYASYLLVFFTLLGSIFLLLGILIVCSVTYNFDFKNLNYEIIPLDIQLLLFVLFFLGFSVKIPIFPFYSWLPEAHVEASTATSILLASIILKTATYGFIKLVIFNFYLAAVYFNTLVAYLSVVSVLVGSFLALFQSDLKKIVALSSIVHMNYMVISLFSLDNRAIIGGIIYMFSHAFISSSLFYIIGYFYDNTSNRDFLNYSSNLNYSTKFLFYLITFNLANISFPLTISFISELIIFSNLTYFNILSVIIMVFSIFFSTVYTFWFIHNVLYNKILLKKNYFSMNKFDFYFLNFFLILVILFGIFPFLIMFNLEQEIYLILINNTIII